jgi:S-adenosylmethionine-diacylglycerol 3-amino-3-carboxypropyl transferase
LNNEKSTPNVDFSFVRYANCWEDPNLLIKALKPAPGKRFLSICSAGDNSLSLIASGAEVVAADLNPAQLACAELRREAIRALDQNEFLQFAGIDVSDDRQKTYRTIRSSLSEEAQRYWDARPNVIATGFIHAGKFEHYFTLFRTRVMPLIHRKNIIHQLLQNKSLEQRQQFYQQRWNNRRWRWLFHLFFSKRIMGKHGRDPEFFKHVEGSVANRILARTEYALTMLDTSNNPYLTYILTGNFQNAYPHYLEPKNYKAIQGNIGNLTLSLGAIDAIATEHGANYFDGYNLSDIFEYLSPEQCTEVYSRLLDAARPKARFAYWNMLVPRKCPASLAESITPLTDEAEALFLEDQAFFYSRFVVEEVR